MSKLMLILMGEIVKVIKKLVLIKLNPNREIITIIRDLIILNLQSSLKSLAIAEYLLSFISNNTFRYVFH